jgi:hypothetical protein
MPATNVPDRPTIHWSLDAPCSLQRLKNIKGPRCSTVYRRGEHQSNMNEHSLSPALLARIFNDSVPKSVYEIEMLVDEYLANSEQEPPITLHDNKTIQRVRAGLLSVCEELVSMNPRITERDFLIFTWGTLCNVETDPGIWGTEGSLARDAEDDSSLGGGPGGRQDRPAMENYHEH